MRETFLIITSTAGVIIASALGGCDYALRALVIFMIIDYVSGLILAGIFKKSAKSSGGALDSNVGFKGIVKKCMMLLMVLIGYQLDNIIGWGFIRYGVIIAFILNELISIIENFGLMGVPIPAVMKQAIGILKKKGDENDANKQNDKSES